MSERGKIIILLLSWIILFLLQIYSTVSGVQDLYLRVNTLILAISITIFSWLKFVEKRTVKSIIAVDEKSIVIFVYLFLAAIVVFFTQRSFWEAFQLLCIYSILPVFEELFFRMHLLGSLTQMSHSFSLQTKQSSLPTHVFPLMGTSILFAFVHDDIITLILQNALISSHLIAAILTRVIFSIAVGELYLSFRKKLIVPITSHLTFNLFHFIYTAL